MGRHNQESAAAQAEELLRLYQTQGHDDYDESRPVDPRMVSLLQYFRELYVEKREIFDKIFLEEFSHDMLHKIGAVLGHDHHETAAGDDKKLTRSLSLDSPRTAAGKREAEEPMRLERFKVKTFDVKGGQGQGGATASATK